jgi:ribonuclease P protein component
MQKSFKFEHFKRIKKASDFKNIQTNGKRFYTKNFLIACLHNELENSRFGIAVSKKVHKRSVIRNKIKRRLREVYRQNQNLIKAGLDFVVIARSGSVECTFDEIQKQIMNALRYNSYLKE